MTVKHGEVKLECIGHSSIRISSNDGPTVYIDPWSNVIDGEPGDADIVLVTHDDQDHYDPDGVAAVAKSDTTVGAYTEIDTSDLQYHTVSLPYDGKAVIDGIPVRTVPAYNAPDGIHTDEKGNPFHAEEEVIGLLFRINGTTVFFSSDSDFLDHHSSLNMDVLIVPIGGHYTMNRHEAADFARACKPDVVFPVHYNTFEAIETDVDAFVEDLGSDGIVVEL